MGQRPPRPIRQPHREKKPLVPKPQPILVRCEYCSRAVRAGSTCDGCGAPSVWNP